MEKHAGCLQQSRKAVHMRDFFMQGNPIVSKRPPQTISFWTLFFLLTFSQCETPIYSKQVTQQSNLVCWGVNDDGQLDIPIFKEEVVDVAAGGGLHGAHSLALLESGQVIAWGWNGFGQTEVPKGLRDVVSIKAGAYHSMALTKQGEVVVWGWNAWSQCDVPESLGVATAIAAGAYHSMALLRDGSVAAWGARDAPDYQVDYGQTRVPPLNTRAIAIAAGRNHSIVSLSDGSVVAWGDGRLGELDVPDHAAFCVSVMAGRSHGIALTAEGKVIAWGDSRAGQSHVPELSDEAILVRSGAYQNLVLLRSGQLKAWGWSDEHAWVPESLGDVVAMSAGNNHCMAVKSSMKGSWHSAARLQIESYRTPDHSSGSVLQLNLTHRTKDLLPARALDEFEIIELQAWAPSLGHLQYFDFRNDTLRGWGNPLVRADSPAAFFNLRPKSD